MASNTIEKEPEDGRIPLKMCRLCLSDESLNSIFEDSILQQWISDYLAILVSPEDCLSQTICATCRLRLTDFHQFRIRCQEVQDKLQSMIQVEDGTKGIKVYEFSDIKAEPHEEVGQMVEAHSSYDMVQDHNGEYHTRMDEKFNAKQSIGIDDEISVEEVKIEYSVNEDSNAAVQVEENLTGVKSFPCNVCHKVYTTSQGLWFHNQSIHMPRKHVCHTCGLGFPVRRDLSRHNLSQKHLNKLRETSGLSSETTETLKIDKTIKIEAIEYAEAVQQFKCDLCEKVFPRKNTLSSHKVKVHGPKKYECNVCGYKFTMRHKLENHMQSHASNRDCKEDFRRLQQFVQIESKQPETSELFDENIETKEANTSSVKACEKCHKVFETQRLLWHHYQNSHTPKKHCTLCKEVFQKSKLLERHMLTKHKKEDGSYQPMKCEICDKVFSTTAQFTLHKRAHGQSKYGCTVCEKSYGSRNGLKHHMSSHN